MNKLNLFLIALLAGGAIANAITAYSLKETISEVMWAVKKPVCVYSYEVEPTAEYGVSKISNSLQNCIETD